MMALKIEQRDDGVHLSLKVVPGAKRDRIVGELGEALKVAVSKPPEGGAANRAVVAILAEKLGLPASDVRIVRGHGSPRKSVVIQGLTAAQVRQRISESGYGEVGAG